MKPYYEHAGITIYHGDCREVFPAVDVILTDPPYGTGQKIAYDVYRDYLPQWHELITWLLSMAQPLAFTMSHTRLADLPKWPQWLGCWDKVWTGGIVHIGASPTWEPICFYNLPSQTRGVRRWDDIFRFTPAGFPFQSPHNADGHPCPKPVNLYIALAEVLPLGVIGDPLMGSGTTLVAAKRLGRKAVGCDVSERYCEIAAQRLTQEVLPLEFAPALDTPELFRHS